MKSISPENMRRIDRLAAECHQIPGIELMESAGRSVADAALELMAAAGSKRAVLLAGKGKNGGDAFVAARLLDERGVKCEIVTASPPESLSQDVLEAWQKLPDHLRHSGDFHPKPGDLVIDGLLGTGISGVPRGRTGELVSQINDSGLPVLAIDLPSGLDAANGQATLAVRADLTVTLAAVKTGMLLDRGPGLCGRIIVADIGIPPELMDEAEDGLPCFGAADAVQLIGREDFDTFKNRRGTVGVIGGAPGMTGAVFLAGEAALRAGAGLVQVYLPQESEVFCAAPRALLVHRFPTEKINDLAYVSADAIAIGPGLGTDRRNLDLIARLAADTRPLLCDADALNLISHEPEAISRHRAPLVLTPHPGEFRRLAAAFGIDSEAPRPEAARALAEAANAVVTLKGARTICAAPDGQWSINLSGNPALATAGSGDVLSGVIAALLAAGHTPWDAARLGVWVHGTAGELLRPCGSRGVIADDLPGAIAAAWRLISPTL